MVLVDYYGTPLVVSECEVLVELERMLRRPVDPYFDANNGHVTELNLSYLRLTSLPESFGRLEFLNDLSIHDNDLTTLPESFGDLKSLKYLDLSANHLSLPNTFGNLQALIVLDFSKNHLTSLPDIIRQFPALEDFVMLDNPFSRLPEMLLHLKALKSLHLDKHLEGDPIATILIDHRVRITFHLEEGSKNKLASD